MEKLRDWEAGMAVTVNRAPNAYQIRIQVQPPGGGPLQMLYLDMSLQRHAYRNLDQAQAKPMNSVLQNAVSDTDIETDLRALGQQVEAKLLGRAQPDRSFQPSLAQQLAGVRQGMDAGGGIRASVNAIEAKISTTVFGDYVVASRRTYRVDNTAINFMTQANHCYPIAGPGLWGNIDQMTFAGIVSFRRLEQALERTHLAVEQIWQKLARDPGGRCNPLYGHFTGAATQFGRLPNPVRQRIVETAGNSRRHQEIGKVLGKIESTRH
jgi:hypothetical protein